jgi:hypothetical protein
LRVLTAARGSHSVLAATATVAGAAALAAACSAQAVRGTDRAGTEPAAATWRARAVLAEPASLGIVSQAFDPRTKTDFALTRGAHGTFTLRRVRVASGQVSVGPSFPVSRITLASGSIWVYGVRLIGKTAERQKLYQVNPRTLAVGRSWTLGPSRVSFSLVAVAPGMHGTVWVAFGRAVAHISARTGATIGSIRVPVGLLAGDAAESPTGRILYVATSDRSARRSPVLEYNVATGRRLAKNTRSVTAASVGGGTLTAAPGGVWVSFRTGMAGLTVLLRQRDLRSVKLAGAGTLRSLFEWQMWAGTVYASPSLYLVQVGGLAGCMNPGTGHIRARGRASGHGEFDQLFGFAPRGRELYAASADGVIAIRPPAVCLAH